ncbi:MAG: energy transducer TonB [Acidobacteriota bacterium]
MKPVLWAEANVAEELPNNSTDQHELTDSHEHDGDSHLDRLLAPPPPTFIVGLIDAIKDLINPPKLPPLVITSKPIEVDQKSSVYAGNEWKAGLLSLGINGGIIGLLLLIGTNQAVQDAVKEKIVIYAPVLLRKPPPPLPPKDQMAQGGGGGNQSKLEESKGKPPKVAPRTFVRPPVDNPKLVLNNSITVDDLPTLNSANVGVADGIVGPFSTGTGSGGGIGPGKGIGVGPGSGGGFGGGAYKIGGGVSQPIPISKPEPEYSEEARKAKHQGSVYLSVIVDEKGVPQDIKVTRKLGLGLDEKAIEAVMKWRFKPGMKDGKAVRVLATIEVTFHLL